MKEQEFNIREWFFNNKGWILYSILSSVIFFTMSAQQNCRQSQLETRVLDAENKAIHRAESNYSIVISGLLQSATIIETNLTETKNHNLLLIDCARKKNCNDSILVEKVQRPYVPIAEHYLKIKDQMVDEEINEEDRKKKE